jgi:hypothetical protein
MGNARKLADLLAGGSFTSVGIDDNADATALTIDSSEKLGIGTASPQDPLHTYLASGQRVARFEANDSTSAHIAFKASNTSLMPTVGVKDEDLYFSTGDAVERARFDADSNGDLILQTGNLVMGTSGKGIDFSANTHSAVTGVSMSSELLDYYEEGTWTPTIIGSGGNPSITTSVAAGKYSRVGNLVFVQWNMIITNVSSQGSGNAQVGGLPYAAVCNTYQGHIGIMYNDVWDTETQKGYVPNGQSHIQLAPTGRTQSNFGFASTLGTGYFGGGGSYVVV